VAALDILLVDDDADFADLAADVLRTDGHRVAVVRNGASAIAAASVIRPDVVLLDLRLPDADGSDVARALRRQLPVSTAIIVVTALPQVSHIDAIDLMVSKPVALELFGGLLEYIRRCRQREIAEGTSR
jgi:DNA-binding response OmpR family regulator